MRIDIHHHFFPSEFNAPVNGKVGWRTPPENLPWTPEISLRCMDELGIDMAVLSFPALSSGEVGQENRELARQRNLLMADICKQYPTRFAFFATVPFFDDVEGVIMEVGYAMDTLKAVGVGLSSSYGDGPDAKYIGDDHYDPIFAELNKRGTAVFVHGAQTPSSTPFPHDFLGLPITEVPNETFKAAAHLVVTQRKRKYPDVKIILAHLGGACLSLAPRVAVLSRHMGCPLTVDEILDDFKTFYLDTALSASDITLPAAQTMVGSTRILYGSDLPAVSTEMAGWYTANLEKFYANNKNFFEGIMSGNALRIMPQLGANLGFIEQASRCCIT